MNINIIHVGQLKEKHFSLAAAEYEKRLSGFCKLNNIYIRESRLNKDVCSESDIAKILDDEGTRIINILPKSKKVIYIALCIEGKDFSTEDLKDLFDKARNDGLDFYFIIGGSHGLSDKVKSICHLRFSMSRMTFPHRLARVMLLEQLYRCSSMIRGGKYHK